MLSGYAAGPSDQLMSGGGAGGGWGEQLAANQDASKYFANNAIGLQQNAQGNMQYLNQLAANGAQDSAGYNAMNNAFLEQSGKGLNSLNRLVGGGGSQMGPAGLEAMRASQNVGPDSELFKSTMSFLTPQVNAAYSSRGLGQSGAAANAVSDQGRQLANSMAERANTERNAFLGTAVGDEGVSANRYGTQMQGATASAEAPSRIFGNMQGGIGQGIQNIGNATGQYLQPMQMNQAAMGSFGQAMGMPVAYQQGLYNFLRSPQTQLLGIPSGTGQQSLAGHPNGLFGDLLGVKKGG
jgi:hypothetical protein